MLPIVSLAGQSYSPDVPARSATHLDSAAKRMDLYCVSNPQSPVAKRRPSLQRRGNVWVALLGRSVQHGVVGLGLTVDAALRAFDVQYRNAMPHRTAT